MMKCEFEEMIGKEVEYETYEMYNAMYGSLPEHVTKQEFVKMLNIEVIPESNRSIEAKKEREEFIKKQRARIEELKDSIKFEEGNRNWYQQCLNESYVGDEWYDFYKSSIKSCNTLIKRYKTQIRELKSVIA